MSHDSRIPAHLIKTTWTEQPSTPTEGHIPPCLCLLFLVSLHLPVIISSAVQSPPSPMRNEAPRGTAQLENDSKSHENGWWGGPTMPQQRDWRRRK